MGASISLSSALRSAASSSAAAFASAASLALLRSVLSLAIRRSRSSAARSSFACSRAASASTHSAHSYPSSFSPSPASPPAPPLAAVSSCSSSTTYSDALQPRGEQVECAAPSSGTALDAVTVTAITKLVYYHYNEANDRSMAKRTFAKRLPDGEIGRAHV
mgnify:CR=1 FL=1